MLLTLSLTGCSPFMSKNPQAWQPSEKPHCNDGVAAPVADVLGASMFAGVAVYFLSLEPSNEPEGLCEDNTRWCDKVFTSFAVLGAVFAGLYALSAYTGFENRRDCRREKRQHEEWRYKYQAAARM
jgi:hypothetical protein